MVNFDRFEKQLDKLRHTDRFRRLVPRQPVGIRFIEDGKEFVNFGSNDYLGLAAEQRSFQNNARRGSGASALVCGWTDLHQKLSDKIAKLESTPSAIVFPSGFAACSGTVATLAGERDLILSDELNHASLIDGCRYSSAKCVVYVHRNFDLVRQTLEQSRQQFDRAWIVTDGVFSMDGHVAPLVQLCDIAEEYDACMVVDEAHGTGVLGESGSGICEALGVKHRVPIRIGTLSKAIASQGGFVAGPVSVIEYLVNRCRPLIYSTSLAPSAVSAAIAGLESVSKQPERRLRVQTLARQLRKGLAIHSSELESSVPIVPVIIGDDRKAMELQQRLAESGFYVPAIRPPTVPEGTSRLRVSLSAAHDEEDIASLIAVLRQG